MMKIAIPGQNDLEVENIVFDFNGTLAVDGNIHQIVKDMMPGIKTLYNVYVLTSDTFGTVYEQCHILDIHVEIMQGDSCSGQKRNFVNRLGSEKTICIGNGINDTGMFQTCALSIIVMGNEGCSAKALSAADIVVKDIEDAMNLLLNPKRITATLRR